MRTHFLDKALLYLFSYNTEIELETQQIGLVPSGFRFNANGAPGESRVFHVLREKQQEGLGPGFKVVTGRIRVGSDSALYREDDVVVDEIRLTIEQLRKHVFLRFAHEWGNVADEGGQRQRAASVHRFRDGGLRGNQKGTRRRNPTDLIASLLEARPDEKSLSKFNGKWCPRPDSNQHALAGNRF